jgi:hypothetical protein
MRAWLHAVGHAPKAGTLWNYRVLATDSGNHPLAGTTESEFAFGGVVVGRESPPRHSLKNGRLNDNITFPARSVGVPLTFQVVVHTHLGTVTLDWRVKAQK